MSKERNSIETVENYDIKAGAHYYGNLMNKVNNKD